MGSKHRPETKPESAGKLLPARHCACAPSNHSSQTMHFEINDSDPRFSSSVVTFSLLVDYLIVNGPSEERNDGGDEPESNDGDGVSPKVASACGDSDSHSGEGIAGQVGSFGEDHVGRLSGSWLLQSRSCVLCDLERESGEFGHG